MEGVQFPQRLQEPTAERGDVDSLASAGLSSLSLPRFSSSLLSRWATIAQPCSPADPESPERLRPPGSEMNSPAEERPAEARQNGSDSPAAAAESNGVPSESFNSLLPKALSAVLHTNTTTHLTPPPPPPPPPPPANLEQLQAELNELRGQFEQMKSQHNKEIKLLMNELDEEKRIRLTLQMEIQRMKKHLSK